VLCFGILAVAQQPAKAAPQAPQVPLSESSCLTCHPEKSGYKEDVHAAKDFGCTACHGGDAGVADLAAMSPAKGFRGKITRARVPELCGGCHSDATFMRNYAPRMRVDQLAQYKTSVHGKKLAAGRTNVATCIDCHGVHGIRPVSDPRSTAFPMHQPETCGRCHTGKERKEYEQSVHWELLSKNRELAAPACATCHGSHGATPPNVSAVANVCGTCHVFLEELFQKSPHAPVFKAAGMRGCVECHSNHRIVRTSDSMVGDQAGAVCLHCHAAGDDGLKVARAMSDRLGGMRDELAAAERGVHRAETYGMEVSDARLEINNANQALVQSRVLVHGLDLGVFDEQIAKGRKAAQSAAAQGLAALHERDVRRRGLLISIAAILLTIAGLYLTIRMIERK
jgi:predicted CXXCH cytochrome family protein